MFECDGNTRPTVDSDMERGTVLRMIHSDGTVAPFSDCVVECWDEEKLAWQLLRPFVKTRDDDCRHAIHYKHEVFHVVQLALFHTVLTASGKPYKM